MSTKAAPPELKEIRDTADAYEAVEENSRLIVRIMKLEAATQCSSRASTGGTREQQRELARLRKRLNAFLARAARWSDTVAKSAMPPLPAAARSAARVQARRRQGQQRTGGSTRKRARLTARDMARSAAAIARAEQAEEAAKKRHQDTAGTPAAIGAPGASSGRERRQHGGKRTPGGGAVDEGDGDEKPRYRGLCRVGKRWKAQITYGGSTHHLGMFENQEDAARAYDAAAVVHHKKASLNFPEEHGRLLKTGTGSNSSSSDVKPQVTALPPPPALPTPDEKDARASDPTSASAPPTVPATDG